MLAKTNANAHEKNNLGRVKFVCVTTMILFNGFGKDKTTPHGKFYIGGLAEFGIIIS